MEKLIKIQIESKLLPSGDFCHFISVKHNLVLQYNEARIFKFFKKNMGSADRILRIIIAAITGVLYSTGTISIPSGIALSVLASVFVLTSLISFYPLYAPFGKCNCPLK